MTLAEKTIECVKECVEAIIVQRETKSPAATVMFLFEKKMPRECKRRLLPEDKHSPMGDFVTVYDKDTDVFRFDARQILAYFIVKSKQSISVDAFVNAFISMMP